MKWQISQPARTNAELRLPREAEKYFAAGRRAIKKRASSKDLHRFRLATKRFRYTLEIFRPIYGRALERRLKTLRALQDALGKISDSQTLIDVLDGDPALRKELDQALKKNVKQFRKEWTAFDSAGRLEEWKAYLGGEPRPALAGPTLHHRAPRARLKQPARSAMLE